jgi:hypothetical protein
VQGMKRTATLLSTSSYFSFVTAQGNAMRSNDSFVF